jgi:hypothetical protein
MINEIAQEHGVHPTQVSQWKKELPDNVDSLFEGKRVGCMRTSSRGHNYCARDFMTSLNQSIKIRTRFDKLRRCGYSSDTGMGGARKSPRISTNLPSVSKCCLSIGGVWIMPKPARQADI